MGYHHQRVPALLADANELRSLNGQQIIGELKNFCLAIERSMRGVKTVIRTANSAWVYMEGEDMAMGWIGYGDFQTSQAAVHKKYAVYARGIRNMKYNDMNEQHYMRVALRMDVALKHAKTYLRRYSTTETGEALFRPVKKAVREVASAAGRAYTECKVAVGVKADAYNDKPARAIIRELGYMVQSGHKFMDAELGANIEAMLDAKKIFARFQDNDIVPMDFVRAYTMDYGEQRVDTIRIKDITSYRFDTDTEQQRTWLAKELPEELMGKVAVMSMCENEEFVEDVGYKVSENMFYLYAEDVTT